MMIEARNGKAGSMKIGLVGARGHWNYVFEALPKLPHVQIVAVCPGSDQDDISPLVNAAAQRGAPPVQYPDYRTMLEQAAVDIVSICGPFEEHACMCIDAFRRGIHVFCEKPAALTLADLDLLRSAHQASGVHFATMMGLRCTPAFLCARKLVQDGAVGTVRMLSARKSYKLGQRPAWYHDRKTYGGTIPWVGSHAIDWIYWFSGQAPFRSVSALHSRKHNAGLGDCEMTAVLQFELDQEILATATLDYLRPAAAPTHGDDRIRVAGTEGIVEVEGDRVTLTNVDGAKEIMPVDCPTVFEDFVLNASQPEKALLGPEDVWAVTRACLLARQAADERRTILFPAG